MIRILRWSAVLLLLIATAASVFLITKGQRPELPILAKLPDFRLTERSGKEAGSAELLGRPWVASFLFTTCSGPCPRLTSQVANLQKRTQSLPDLRFVSISVDPTHDTPEILRAYADKYQAPAERWWFFTGDADAIYSLARNSFLLGAEKTGTEIIHSTKLILVDQAAQIRGYYDSSDPLAMDQLITDIETLE